MLVLNVEGDAVDESQCDKERHDAGGKHFAIDEDAHALFA